MGGVSQERPEVQQRDQSHRHAHHGNGSHAARPVKDVIPAGALHGANRRIHDGAAHDRLRSALRTTVTVGPRVFSNDVTVAFKNRVSRSSGVLAAIQPRA